MAWCKRCLNGLSKEHNSPLAEKLAKKIKEQIGFDLDPNTFRRTYVGYWQKSAGAFLWTMSFRNSPRVIGSCDPASLCVRKDHKLEATSDHWDAEISAEPIPEIIRAELKPIIEKKVKERELNGYENLNDSDIKDIFDECRRKNIMAHKSDLQFFGIDY